jgi:hypothetical protein
MFSSWRSLWSPAGAPRLPLWSITADRATWKEMQPAGVMSFDSLLNDSVLPRSS